MQHLKSQGRLQYCIYNNAHNHRIDNKMTFKSSDTSDSNSMSYIFYKLFGLICKTLMSNSP